MHCSVPPSASITCCVNSGHHTVQKVTSGSRYRFQMLNHSHCAWMTFPFLCFWRFMTRLSLFHPIMRYKTSFVDTSSPSKGITDMSALANCMACVNAPCRICFVLFDIDEPIPIPFLGAFAQLLKATISVVMSVCPSAWNNSATTGRILVKFDI